MLSVANKPIKFNVVMLSADMLNVVAPERLARDKHSSLLGVTNLSDETLELQLRQVVPVQGEAVRKRVQLFVLDLQLDLQKRKSALPCSHLSYYALPSDHLP